MSYSSNTLDNPFNPSIADGSTVTSTAETSHNTEEPCNIGEAQYRIGNGNVPVSFEDMMKNPCKMRALYNESVQYQIQNEQSSHTLELVNCHLSPNMRTYTNLNDLAYDLLKSPDIDGIIKSLA